MRAQKEAKSTLKKAYVILGNIYIYLYKQNVGRNIKVLLLRARGNREHVIGNGKKGSSCYNVGDTSLN